MSKEELVRRILDVVAEYVLMDEVKSLHEHLMRFSIWELAYRPVVAENNQ